MKIFLSLIKSTKAYLLICVILTQNVYAENTPGALRSPSRISFVPGHVLVQFKQTTPTALINNINSAEKASPVTKFPHANKLQLLRLEQGQSVNATVQKYKKNPNVIYAEPDYIYTTDAVTPNDTHFAKLWGLHNSGQEVNASSGTIDADIDAPQAWATTPGSPDIIIGVLGSGVAWNHEDLVTNIWSNSSETLNGTDSDGNGKEDDVRGWDFVDDDNDPYDFNGHGTHMAGIIAAIGNNAKGVTGVNWNARIMPMRVLDTHGSGTTSDIVAGIQYAIANGAHIINASLGGPDYSQIYRDAIEAAGDAGVLFVTSAGNNATDNGGIPQYPSDYTLANIISVAATDANDALADFSNYGTNSVDVAAPGVNIFSTEPKVKIVWKDNFNDGDISDWLTGGPGTNWSTTGSGSSFELTDSAGDDYQNNSDSWARSPAFKLSHLSGCTLDYTLTASLETDFDFLIIEASTDGNNFSPIQTASFFDDTQTWFVSAPLESMDGQANVYIRFRLLSDDSNVFDGVTIDNVEVSCIAPKNISTYAYGSGTSMAAAHVTGLASLILSKNNTLTVAELKALILDHGDPLPTLSGKTATGKRINAFTSISNTPNSSKPKETQSISFTPLTDKTYGDTDFLLSASADSGLIVKFSSDTTGVCTVNTATVSIITTGACTIRASQAGNSNYQPATDVSQSFSVLKASITSFISSPMSAFTGDTTSLSATPSPSSSPVVYASITPSICTVSGTTVTLLTIGTCTITANQAGDANYDASPQQTLDITVSNSEPPVETGFGHTCFTNSNGKVECWGR